MSTTILPPTAFTPPIPPLQEGDRLSRDEFERRYHSMPENVKAELIEGVVYMASPVSYEAHCQPDGRLIVWIGMYQGSTPGTDFGVNGTVRLEEQSEPQPDSFLFIVPECGGQVRISEDDYVEHAPELVIEITSNRTSAALGAKKRAYARAGVKEYIVWRTFDESIEWSAVRGDAFVPLLPDANGLVRSEVFPGLWLNVPAAIRRDTAAILGTLLQGLASPEHARFVAELQARRTS